MENPKISKKFQINPGWKKGLGRSRLSPEHALENIGFQIKYK